MIYEIAMAQALVPVLEHVQPSFHLFLKKENGFHFILLPYLLVITLTREVVSPFHVAGLSP